MGALSCVGVGEWGDEGGRGEGRGVSGHRAVCQSRQEVLGLPLMRRSAQQTGTASKRTRDDQG